MDTDLHNITPTYFKIELKDDCDDYSNLIKAESIISLEDNISQYVIRHQSPGGSICGTDHYVIPSTSCNEFSMMIEEVKHEPEEILSDLILPDVEEIEEIEEIQEIQEIEESNEGFEIIEERTVAYEVKRNAQGELECPICLAIFKIGANLERHIQIHDKKYVFSLTKTNETTNVNPQNPIKSSASTTTTNQGAAAAALTAVKAAYPCEYCNATFEYKKLLRKHLTSDHKNRKRDIKCQLCVYCTDNKHHFREHLLRHQKYDQRLTTNPELVKCIKCPALLKNDRSLKIHEKHVHSNTKHTCQICQKLFKTKQILKNHLKLVHMLET